MTTRRLFLGAMLGAAAPVIAAPAIITTPGLLMPLRPRRITAEKIRALEQSLRRYFAPDPSTVWGTSIPQEMVRFQRERNAMLLEVIRAHHPGATFKAYGTIYRATPLS